MRVHRNTLIALRDGVSVAADLFLPDDGAPVPAVFSYYPYRKDDYIGAFAGSAVEYFANHGYASLLVDFRGLGSSGGIAWDAMDAREADDGYDIVEWIAEQPWCDGHVGIWGISYGGIMSFKTAALKPPHLSAMVPIMGSLDIYHDWFYPGGCFNALGASTWAGSMVGLQLMPPTLQDTDGRWYEVWLERIENSEPYLLPWREHPSHDDYWGSKVIDPARIATPTFLIGGWRDLFPELMVRAYEQIDAPRQLLMGPWLHTLPDLDGSAPIDYLAIMRRWWDRWMKDDESAAEADPVTLYIQNEDVWRDESEWPPARTETRTLFLGKTRGLSEQPGDDDAVVYDADPSVGAAAGLWDPMSLGVGLPLDQSADDARSIAFTGEPLAEPLEITGSPEALIHVALQAGEDANLVVKLCEVSPGGFSTLITTGWLKASHRTSHEHPEPPTPNEVNEYRIQLWATAYRVPAGHRLRVSVSCSDFPRVWPTPSNPRIRLQLGNGHPSSVILPVVPPDGAKPAKDMPLPDASINPIPLVLDYRPVWKAEHDLAQGRVSVTMGMTWTSHLPSGIGRLDLAQSSRASVSIERPDGAHIEEETTVRLQMDSGSEVQVDTKSWHTARSIAAWGRILIDGRPFFERQWRG
ncbi:MAG: CocE/NonD family hydrolase [Solirubrobacteraceae bacterium]